MRRVASPSASRHWSQAMGDISLGEEEPPRGKPGRCQAPGGPALCHREEDPLYSKVDGVTGVGGSGSASLPHPGVEEGREGKE